MKPAVKCVSGCNGARGGYGSFSQGNKKIIRSRGDGEPATRLWALVYLSRPTSWLKGPFLALKLSDSVDP